MIVNVDVTGLEVLGVAFLSQDQVLYNELNSGVDIHSANQEAFGLPNRLIAKVLKFRLVYGGSEFGFVHDPDFTCVSSSLKYWRKAIDKYYNKYQGIYKWHQSIVQEVGQTSKLTMCTGREYEWDLTKFGSFKIPEPQVKNYPVQGFGADIMSVIRISFARRFYASNIKGVIINTVHDSIVVDVEDNDVAQVVEILRGVFKDASRNISKAFNIDFDLEVKCEIEIGMNQGEMEEVA